MRTAGTLPPRLARRHARRSGQRGQALLEFTMIFVFIMLLLAGVSDIGGLLDIHIAMVYAARQGARTGAVLGPVDAADCAIVGAVHSTVVNQPNLTVTLITIYQAGADGLSTGNAQYYPGTSDCVAGQIVNLANLNSLGVPQPQSALPGSNWPAVSVPPASSLRINTPYFENSIGVKVDYTYQFQFNLLGSGPFSTSDYAVYPINPQAGS